MVAGGSEGRPRTRRYWASVCSALLFRVALICFFPNGLDLASRPEVATPVTSLRRLAEGYWLKQSNMSPYAGSMYHGSALLLPILGPLTVKRIEGLSGHAFCSLLFVITDFVTAMLIRATGQKLQLTSIEILKSRNLSKASDSIGNDDRAIGDVASLVFLWNPLTILTCVGSSTSPIENLMVVLTLYGASSCLAPLAAFGWVIATHLSLYPVFLIVPITLLLGYGIDTPPKKLLRFSERSSMVSHPSWLSSNAFSWRPVVHFFIWASIWSLYILILCGIFLKDFGSLVEMFKKTYGFILSVEDLSPNIGIMWYFFAEVFDLFRYFFLIVVHINILFMVLPLALRLKHRPCFLAFVYMAICSMLKSYPSIGDSALYLGLLALFFKEVKDIRFSFFLFSGYIGVLLLSPVMHNLWIWRGTGNANFYFATGLAYACLQTVLVVETVNAMLYHDRYLKKLLAHGA